MTDEPTPRVRNITQLARLAGVSPGTVSRALADSPLISQKTRDHVQALARAHQFRPNAAARNLRTRRTNAIGVLIPLGHESDQHISDPFFITMLGYLADALTERGFDLLLSRVIPDDPAWLQLMIASGRVDGIILIGQSDQAAVIDDAARNYAPLVVWGAQRADARYCTVGTDNIAGGALAAQHLIARGCRSFAFFGDPVAPEIDDRLNGFRAALVAGGFSADDLRLLPAHLTPEIAQPAVTDWLRAHPSPPDGIFAASDVIAISTLRGLAQAGHAVPDRVRVIGYDDLSLAQHAMPPLTTIRQDLLRGAEALASLLLRRIGGEATASLILPPALIVRQSA